MIIFAICLIFNLSVVESILWAVTINFWVHLVLGTIVVVLCGYSDNPGKTFSIGLMSFGIVLTSYLIYNSSLESLPTFGFILLIQEVLNNLIVSTSYKK